MAPTSSHDYSAASLERNVDGKPRFTGCAPIRDYDVISKLGEGTFGEVYKARSKRRRNLVALKKILMHNEKDGFPITALREIKLLKMLSHPNVLILEEMAYERSKTEGRKKATMYMVTLYMDHDLSGLLENPAVHITEAQIKCYMLQLLEGVRYLHEMQILHRDMKAANILINNKGILQIADFGLARPYDDAPPVAGCGGGEGTRSYTTLVVTRWYRPPELLLQLRRYTTAIDMWGVGCVFGEMFKGRPILPGNSDLNQAQMIFDMVGAPTEENMPGWRSLPGCEGVRDFQPRSGNLHHVFRENGSGMISLLSELLRLDWRKRINAIDALEHPYFKQHPLPAKPGELPQFEESHELDRRKFRDQKSKLPPAPAGGTVGMGGINVNGNWANGVGPPPYNDQRRPPPPPGPPHPPGPPRNGHDGRLPSNQTNQVNIRGSGLPPAQNERRPAYAGQRDLGLPPRPVATNLPPAGWDPTRNTNVNRPPRIPPPPPGRGPSNPNHGPPSRDTYVPAYSNGNEAPRGRDYPPPHNGQDRMDRGRYGDRLPPYDGGGRRRSRSPMDRDRHAYARDRDPRDSREVYRR